MFNYINLNTSHVNVNLRGYVSILENSNHLNTSHVNVNLVSITQ